MGVEESTLWPPTEGRRHTQLCHHTDTLPVLVQDPDFQGLLPEEDYEVRGVSLLGQSQSETLCTHSGHRALTPATHARTHMPTRRSLGVTLTP